MRFRLQHLDRRRAGVWSNDGSYVRGVALYFKRLPGDPEDSCFLSRGEAPDTWDEDEAAADAEQGDDSEGGEGGDGEDGECPVRYLSVWNTAVESCDQLPRTVQQYRGREPAGGRTSDGTDSYTLSPQP